MFSFSTSENLFFVLNNSKPYFSMLKDTPEKTTLMIFEVHKKRLIFTENWFFLEMNMRTLENIAQSLKFVIFNHPSGF